MRILFVFFLLAACGSEEEKKPEPPFAQPVVVVPEPVAQPVVVVPEPIPCICKIHFPIPGCKAPAPLPSLRK